MSWDRIVGQPGAVQQLRASLAAPVHAYLFVGPTGVGKRRAATVFAGELLAAADPENSDRHRHLAASERHADVHVVDPVGNSLRRDEEAEPLIVEASRSPVEASRKVLIVNRFHTATPAAAASLLKTIEEPPASSIFVLLAESVPPEHVTIESRCSRVDFAPIPAEAIAGALIDEGLVAGDEEERASVVAQAAGGSIERARVLATDAQLAARRDAWWSVPDRLDGTGAAVVVLVEEVRALIDEASAAMVGQHNKQLEALEAREEQLGTRGSGRKDLEARQRRELRQFRTGELRFGLSTLAGRYRSAIVSGDERGGLIDSVDALRQTQDALIRNPNEALALQALFVRLAQL